MKKLERGAATFTVLEIQRDETHGNNQERIELALLMRAKDPRADGAESASGFTSGKAAMDAEINEKNSVIDGVLKLHYRTIQKKVVAPMLRALIEKMEEEARAENDGRLTRKERKQIKEDARMVLEKDAPYTIKEIEIVFGKTEILIGSTSRHDVEVVENMLRTLHISTRRVWPVPPANSNRAEFFSWLMNGEKKPWGQKEIETSFAGAVEFYADGVKTDEENSACTKATLDGPAVSESEEIRTVLKNRKNISRAKIHLSDGSTAWTFKFDAEQWTFHSVKITGSFGDGLYVRSIQLCRLNTIMTGLFEAWKKQQEEAAGIQELPGLNDAEKAGTLAGPIDEAIKKAATPTSAVETTKKRLEVVKKIAAKKGPKKCAK